MFNNSSNISEILATNYSNISSDVNYEPTFRSSKMKKFQSIFHRSSPSIQRTHNRIRRTVHHPSMFQNFFSRPRPTILQKIHPNSMTLLTSLLNRCLSLVIFPSSWKRAAVISIFKPSKDPFLPSI